MKISPESIDAADQRMAERLAEGPRASSARYDRRRRRVVVQLESGVELAFSPNGVQGVDGAPDDALSSIEVSPSGLGLHFPMLDADVFLPALIAGVRGSARWMATELGRAGGRSTSRAKAVAARRNGALGGRPRKTLAES
ncbi:MAG: DUF2442 domain-containing protein [Burkholderiaceae bacterium]|nr:DUF2442 domain-containing protein [Burkholderiaceae bacterium]